MRFTLITICVALVLAIGVCLGCVSTIDRAIYEMQDISTLAIDFVNAGDNKTGAEQMVRLASKWEAYRPWLEVMTSHEDLHAVTEHYTEAAMNLERDHLDDFHKSMALLDESLKHIRDQEALTISNVF